MNDSGRGAIDGAFSGGSPDVTGLIAVRRRLLWLAPLALLLVFGLGYWAYASVERSQKQQHRDELQALLRASVEGIATWFTSQELLANAVASDPAVIDAAMVLEEAAASGSPVLALSEHPAQRALRDKLALLMSGTHYDHFRIARRNGVVVASSTPPSVELPTAASSADRVWAMADETRIWPPYLSRAGALQMAVSAPIRAKETPVATIFLVFDPGLDFSSILSAARSGSSGETYAFDESGRLVSQSRFDDALRSLGLISVDAPSAVLNLELRDPGVDLAQRDIAAAHDVTRPFTTPVRNALADRRSGFDVDGYRDYRGKPVIGAWTWLKKYDMGIVTEKDAAEAFALRDTVRRAMAFLFAALIAVLLALLAVAHFASILQRRTKRAEARVQQLGQYQLTRKLGEGGMGTVYVGQHKLLRRPTAIKLLRTDGDPDGTAAARFEREVRITSQLTHPNTIAVYDYGVTADGTFYYAMELLDGLNLDDLVASTGPLPPGRTIHLLLQACGSLAEAHEAGLIHRDVKPANMFVCTRGGIRDTLKVLDFGLVKQARSADAKLTNANSILGTPAFVAPELLHDAERASPASDVYSLGATAYYVLTGHAVFERRETFQIFTAHATEPPPSMTAYVASIPPDLEGVVLRCLEKNPENRFADMEALAVAFRACADYGRWSQDDARAFWNAHSELRQRLAKPASTTAATASLKPDVVTRGVA